MTFSFRLLTPFIMLLIVLGLELVTWLLVAAAICLSAKFDSTVLMVLSIMMFRGRCPCPLTHTWADFSRSIVSQPSRHMPLGISLPPLLMAINTPKCHQHTKPKVTKSTKKWYLMFNFYFVRWLLTPRNANSIAS